MNTTQQRSVAENSGNTNGLPKAPRANKKKAGLRRRIDVTSSENDYLQTMLDPEKYRDVRYPDDYAGLTAMVQGLINHDMYYFNADSSSDPSAEAAGLYLNVVSPVITHPVLEYVMDQPTTLSTVWSLFVSKQTDEVGLFPLEEDVPTITDTLNEMVLVTGDPVNVNVPYFWNDQDFAIPSNRFSLPDGTVAYGIPFTNDMANAASGVGVTVNLGGLATMGDTLTVTAYNSLGASVVGTSAPLAGGAQTAQVNLNVGTIMTTLLNGSVSAGLPGIAFRLTYNKLAGAGIMPLESIFITQALSAPRTAGWRTNRFVAVDFPDQPVYAETIDKYRVVSSSSWIEYQGSDLNNGGQHAALYYAGGRSPFSNGLWNYSSVAQTPGSYQGGLRYGSYSIWKPSDPRDMLFRELNPEERWRLPYIVHAGLVGTPDQVNSLRLRVPTNIEFMSTSQLYNYKRCLPNVAKIEHANILLRDFPTSMENPSHWQAIKDALSKAVGVAKGFGKWVVDNKSWLVPAGAAVGSLLL